MSLYNEVFNDLKLAWDLHGQWWRVEDMYKVWQSGDLCTDRQAVERAYIEFKHTIRCDTCDAYLVHMSSGGNGPEGYGCPVCDFDQRFYDDQPTQPTQINEPPIEDCDTKPVVIDVANVRHDTVFLTPIPEIVVIVSSRVSEFGLRGQFAVFDYDKEANQITDWRGLFNTIEAAFLAADSARMEIANIAALSGDD